VFIHLRGQRHWMTGSKVHSTVIDFHELSPTLGHWQQVENSEWKVPSQRQQTIAIVIAKKQTSRRQPNARKQ
jgi:hypothetical protein